MSVWYLLVTDKLYYQALLVSYTMEDADTLFGWGSERLSKLLGIEPFAGPTATPDAVVQRMKRCCSLTHIMAHGIGVGIVR